MRLPGRTVGGLRLGCGGSRLPGRSVRARSSCSTYRLGIAAWSRSLPRLCGSPGSSGDPVARRRCSWRWHLSRPAPDGQPAVPATAGVRGLPVAANVEHGDGFGLLVAARTGVGECSGFPASGNGEQAVAAGHDGPLSIAASRGHVGSCLTSTSRTPPRWLRIRTSALQSGQRAIRWAAARSSGVGVGWGLRRLLITLPRPSHQSP
jgi:hypothetical protein